MSVHIYFIAIPITADNIMFIISDPKMFVLKRLNTLDTAPKIANGNKMIKFT